MQELACREIREITFEIGIMDKYGREINDLRERSFLRVLPEEDLLGATARLHHVRWLQED